MAGERRPLALALPRPPAGLGAAVGGTVSHGNTARSVAAHAAGEGLTAVVRVPADVPPERPTTTARHGSTILRVDGDDSRLYGAALDAGAEADVAVADSDTPLRVAGQETTGLEVHGHASPDAAGMSVAGGGHASGVWKAIREATLSGLVDDPTDCASRGPPAARELADGGEIGADEEVVLVATGTGYTERDVGDAPAPDADVVALQSAVDRDR